MKQTVFDLRTSSMLLLQLIAHISTVVRTITRQYHIVCPTFYCFCSYNSCNTAPCIFNYGFALLLKVSYDVSVDCDDLMFQEKREG